MTASTTPTTEGSTTPTTATPTETSAVTPTPTERLSTIARRTGFTITKDNQPIDSAGLVALGWVVRPEAGEAFWVDPSLGSLSVTWELPDASVVEEFDVQFWGEVTGDNLAMAPSMYADMFTGGPLETTAHSVGGTRADAPTRRLRVTVPSRPAGTTASVSINLGFPVPVLVTYTYVYE